MFNTTVKLTYLLFKLNRWDLYPAWLFACCYLSQNRSFLIFLFLNLRYPLLSTFSSLSRNGIRGSTRFEIARDILVWVKFTTNSVCVCVWDEQIKHFFQSFLHKTQNQHLFSFLDMHAVYFKRGMHPRRTRARDTFGRNVSRPKISHWMTLAIFSMTGKISLYKEGLIILAIALYILAVNFCACVKQRLKRFISTPLTNEILLVWNN